MLQKATGKRVSRYKKAEEEGAAKMSSLTPYNDNQAAYIDAAVVEFTLDDVVRSDICKQWLTAFYGEAI